MEPVLQPVLRMDAPNPEDDRPSQLSIARGLCKYVVSLCADPTEVTSC